jgi:integrase
MGNLHRLLALILKSAVKAKKLASSPIGDIQTKPKPQRKKIEILDEAELSAMLEHLRGGPIYLPALVSACSGLRRGEVFALRWTDINFAKGTLHVARQVQNIGGRLVTLVPKTDYSRRTIRLPQTLLAALNEHRATQAANRLRLGLGKDAAGLVITDPVGQQIDPDDFSKAFSAAAKAIKSIRFHALRHTHITHLLREGVPVHVVSARAGHSNPNITLSTYAHLLGGDDERAADKAEEILQRTLR